MTFSLSYKHQFRSTLLYIHQFNYDFTRMLHHWTITSPTLHLPYISYSTFTTYQPSSIHTKHVKLTRFNLSIDISFFICRPVATHLLSTLLPWTYYFAVYAKCTICLPFVFRFYLCVIFHLQSEKRKVTHF